ncbi:non-ribosomal peptide synthase [Pseudomonas chlororaphis subsp. aurantiaca]|nr:non-ribosomal peptide synthase [Pseudomonas chlororaphis subsp. aurantiaca]
MSRTLLPFTERPQGAPVLLCFGPAGCGPSFYRRWAKLLGSPTQLLAVQLPGREGRHREPRVTDFSQLVTQLADDINQQVTGEYSFFGHSLGAALGFAVAQELEQRHARQARTLVVSARTVPDEARLTGIDPQSSDRELIDFLISLGCLPPQLAADTEAMQMYLPIIRDDLRLNIEAQRHSFGRVHSDLVALAGTHDALAPPAQMLRWAQHTHRRFALHHCQGGHFFILEQEQDTLDLLRRIVDGHATPAQSPARTGART